MILKGYRNQSLKIAVGLIGMLIFLILQGCSSGPSEKESKWTGFIEFGKASYYSKKFQSKKTASGELYDKHKRTAAHKKLPFGTKIKVTNLKNRKTVIVKINDRGPFVKGRIVDLSSSAFNRIAHLETGIIDVKIEVIQ